VPKKSRNAPRPSSHGRSVGAPVKARDAPDDPVEADPPKPEESETLPPEALFPPVDAGAAAAGVTVDVVDVVPVPELVGVVAVVVAVVVVVVVLASGWVNEIVTLWPVSARLSVVSVAVYVTCSAVVSVTANVAWPLEADVPVTVRLRSLSAPLAPLSAVTTELPPEGARVTLCAGTGLPSASYKRTVTVADVVPSAATLCGLATIAQSAGTGGGMAGLPKVTTASALSCSKSVVSVAIYPTTS
jgi:hypothetical protein